MKTFHRYLNEKKTKNTESKKTSDVLYWVPDAWEQLKGILMQIYELGGFSGNEKISNYLKDEDNEKFYENSGNAIDEMLNVKIEDWKKNGKQIKPTAIISAFKDSLDSLKNAGILLRGATEDSRAEEERIKGTTSTGAIDFNKFMNQVKSTTNHYVSLANGNRKIENTSSLSDGLVIRLTSLLGRINNLQYLVDSIIDGRKIDDIEGLTEEQRSLLKEISGTLGSIKDKITSDDIPRISKEKDMDKALYRKYNATYNTQLTNFINAKDGFLDAFGNFLEKNSKAERIYSLLAEASNKVSQANIMISDMDKNRSMFKGISDDSPLKEITDKYDDNADSAIDKTVDSARKRYGEDTGSGDSGPSAGKKETTFNTVKVDQQLRNVFGNEIEIGEVEADMNKLKRFLKVK